MKFICYKFDRWVFRNINFKSYINTQICLQSLNLVRTFRLCFGNEKIKYNEVVKFNLDEVEPTIAGPKRPQDKILLHNLKLLKILFS